MSEVRSEDTFLLKNLHLGGHYEFKFEDNNEQINSRAGLGLPVAFQELL